MSEEKTYRVVRGSIRMPRSTSKGFMLNRQDMLMQGDLLPPDVFTAADIRSWLHEGRIEEAGVSVEVTVEAERIRASNPFRVDPSTLVGKTMEDLVIMVLEIDEEFDTDTLEDEKAAVRLLTSGWDPKYVEPIAPVNDRSRPEALALHKLEQDAEGGKAVKSGDSALSADAQAGLAAAKERAQAPADDSSAQ